jgi:ankyrin repeat protein
VATGVIEALLTHSNLTSVPYSQLFHLPVEDEEKKRFIRRTGQLDAIDDSGRWPLHHAIAAQCSVDLLNFLIDSYPSSLHRRDFDGYLPLHCAVNAHASLETITQLVLAYPHAAGIRDDSGNLPLISAIHGGMSADIVRVLIVASHDCEADLTASDDDNPLLLALRTNTCLQVVQTLVGAFPYLLSEKDSQGMTPFHAAIRESHSLPLKLFLLEQRPASAQERDLQGNLPLHYFVTQHATKVVLESAHPHSNGTTENFSVSLPDVSECLVTFDDRTFTNHVDAAVTFFKDGTLTDYWDKSAYSGGCGEWPGQAGMPPLRIPSNNFIVHFYSAPSNAKGKGCYYPVIFDCDSTYVDQ